jgi:hypothetical protein
MGGTLLVGSFMMFAFNVIATIVVRRPFELPEIAEMTATIPAPAPTFAGE